MPAQFAGDRKPRVQVGLQGLPDDEFLHRADGVADEVDVFVLELGAEERAGDHGEGHLHQVRIDVDRAAADLAVEVAQRLGERVLHDGGQRSSCLRSKPFWMRRRWVLQASPWVVSRPLPRKWPIRFTWISDL